jgi:hypothetical protein
MTTWLCIIFTLMVGDGGYALDGVSSSTVVTVKTRADCIRVMRQVTAVKYVKARCVEVSR